MSKPMRDYIYEGMELWVDALIPFVETRLETAFGTDWQTQVQSEYKGDLPLDDNDRIAWDQLLLLRIIDIFWADAFREALGREDRSIVNELIVVRNKHAHNKPFSYDDTERALDSMRRLATSIGATQAANTLETMRNTILRTKFHELQRNEERKQTPTMLTETPAGLKPWREVAEPHPDVASGHFLHAEFAADLSKVHNDTAPPEYSNPTEFFSRTYLTNGLKTLLTNAANRLAAQGGDPVVELQTNFGGGKTHSMLALYHMAGTTNPQDLPGLDQLLNNPTLTIPENIHRAVIVGTARGPQDPIRPANPNNIEIHTTWGELAWQLGNEPAYNLIAEHDKSGIAPGSQLLETLFTTYSPTLILIDEWIAYLRQIYKTKNLGAGSFDANLSFVQSLTEAVKNTPQTLLVASLPESDIEVGGEGGREALTRLKQTFSRLESSWRPASQEESYEIVRRRLFKTIPSNQHQHKDNTLKQFAKLYRDNPNDFPQNCTNEMYRRKLEKAYPIHPELFDQLYTTWGSLEKFQRTRGILRLMAQLIHQLWINNDASAMIMPGNVTVNSERVAPELRRYLHDQWEAIIAADVDGENATPHEIDKTNPHLGKHAAARRVARTIFIGTAPTKGQENKGLNHQQINLGVIQPGEKSAIFGDALRRLANEAKYIHSELGRYWFSENPSLGRMAAERASQIENTLVFAKINQELTKHIHETKNRAHFHTVQIAPNNSAEVPDEADGVRAVVLGIEYPHSSNGNSDAINEVKNIFMHRGKNNPRTYRNMLVFLAPDVKKIDDLKKNMRTALAWETIVKETQQLNLTQSDSRLAEEKYKETNEAMKTRIKETWRYIIYPRQETPQDEPTWETPKMSEQDELLERASKTLANNEALLPKLGPERLQRELQKYIWNDSDHISLKKLWDHLSCFVYLPRLKNQNVLIEAVKSAVSNAQPGPFAYAEQWDSTNETYKGLVIENSPNASVIIDADSVIIKPDVAETYRPKPETKTTSTNTPAQQPENTPEYHPHNTPKPEADSAPRRFVGTVMISSDRPARDMGQIVEDIVEHLTTLPNSDVSLKLEIVAEAPGGFDRSKVRTILENASTRGFSDKEFS